MAGGILQKFILPVAIIVAGFGAVIFLTGYIQRSRPPIPVEVSDADLHMNGSRLKGFAFGMEGLIADWYWSLSLQYIGNKILNSPHQNINIDDLRDLDPRLLYPYLENATDLDPHFIGAYSYGAMVLPAIDPEKAIRLTAKGIAHNPGDWRLYQYMGFIYWRMGQYDKASEAYEIGSRIADAAPFMKMMAAAMKTEGGGRDTARQIYREMLAEADDDQVKITARRRLMGLDSLDERDVIDKTLTDFKEKAGRCANSFGEVGSMLLAAKLPENRSFSVDSANRLVDPSGTPYLLDKENCKVKLDLDHSEIPHW